MGSCWRRAWRNVFGIRQVRAAMAGSSDVRCTGRSLARQRSLVLVALSTEDILYVISLGATSESSVAEIVASEGEPQAALARPLTDVKVTVTGAMADREQGLILQPSQGSKLYINFSDIGLFAGRELPWALRQRRAHLAACNGVRAPIAQAPITVESSQRLSRFERTTRQVWDSGLINTLDPEFQKAPPLCYPVEALLRGYELADTEILVVCGSVLRYPLDFVLTSHRLLVYDHALHEHVDLAVETISNLETTVNPDRHRRLLVKFKDGGERVFDSLLIAPGPRGLAVASALARQAVQAG
jgi:hypothetical protein